MSATEIQDGAQFMAAAQTERMFSDAIVELARRTGWLVHRDPVWRATGTDAGYPDLTLTRQGWLIFAELKLDKARSKTTDAQEGWLTALRMVPCAKLIAAVWRPSDWDLIQAVLT